METIYILSVIVFLIVLFLFGNILVVLRIRQQTKDAFREFENQILNKIKIAVEIVKEAGRYVSCERDLISEVLKAKKKADEAKTFEEKKEAGSIVSIILDSVFKVSEKYPELKTSKKFTDLKNELKDIEEGVESARKLYQESLEVLKKLIESKPFSMIIGFFNKKKEVEEVKVKKTNNKKKKI